MRRFSEPQHPQPQEPHDSGGTVLRRTGAAAPPFGVPRNRPMFSGSRHPRRSPGTDRGCIRQRQSSDATGVPTARGPAVKAKRHRQDGRRQNIGKTSRRKTSARQTAGGTRITGSAEDAPARRRHWQRRSYRWSLPRIETIRCTRASCGTRASPASESPRARRTSANAIYRASARQARRTPQDSPRAPKAL